MSHTIDNNHLAYSLHIFDVISITPDGKVKYKCAPDEAAKAFWQAVEKFNPIRQKLEKCVTLEDFQKLKEKVCR